ncbi:Reverse transcriptase domain-containing protein [Aphis craccivora]|uniref:Reverse transcriptase domain-containing protein n=1 Tax=Aphis craccivora TaxID=307492 RepID=A0A6G0X8A2_APHCR|nr:Reverse transcriptase domain-containing protein [Aphis craccivora]
MSKYIRVVQHNVNREKIASHQLRDYSVDIKADIVLKQEPVVSMGKVSYDFEDQAYLLRGNKAGSAIIELSQYNFEYIIAVKVGRRDDANAMKLVSAYFK